MSGIIGNTRPPWYKRISFKRKRYRHGRCIYLDGFKTLVSFEEFHILYNYVTKCERSRSFKRRWEVCQAFFQTSNMDASYCYSSLLNKLDDSMSLPISEYRSRMNDLINEWDVYEEKIGVTIKPRVYWNCVLESLQ